MTGFPCVLLLLVCCSTITTCIQQADLLKKSKLLQLGGLDNSLQNEVCTERYSCLNCNTVRICAPNSSGQLKEIEQVTCSGSTPICNPATGTCSQSNGIDCLPSLPGYSFVCQNDGYFPDGQDCTLFHYCKNSVAFTYDCSSLSNNSYYNVNTKQCETGYYYFCNRDPFYCSYLNGEKSPHDYDNSIFAYCISGQPQIIDRCEGNAILNRTSQTCELKCVREGLIPDLQDCLSYYECKLVTTQDLWSTYERIHKKCREGEAFEPSEFQCVPISKATSCTSPYSTIPPYSTLSTPTPSTNQQSPTTTVTTTPTPSTNVTTSSTTSW